MICASFPSFRYQFAVVKDVTVTATFNPAGPGITRASGEWDTDGFEEGMDIFVSGASNAANNGRRVIASVGTPTMTTTTDSTLVSEGPTANVHVIGVHCDVDGLETWPIQLVRSAGFDDGLGDDDTLSEIRRGVFQSLNLTINDYASDAAYGVDEYDWYLSQGTDAGVTGQLIGLDGTARWHALPYNTQLISGVPTYVVGATTHSGSIFISSSGQNNFVTGSIDYQKRLMWNRVHLYVRRRSDGAIQWFDMSKLAFQ